MSTGSSGSGFGGGGSNRPGRGDDPWQAPASRGGDPDDTLAYGAPRAERDTAGGQGRSVSYQPEERYWTDYLRLALPVIGLLLMLGLFLFWLNNLIDGSSNTPPTEQVIVGEIIPTVDTIGAASPSAVTTTAPTNTVPVDPAAVTTATVAPGAGDTATDPTAPPADGDTFPIGSDVQVSADDGLTLRSEASVDGQALLTLDFGAILTITGEPEQGGDLTWYPVEVEGNQGWVAADFIEAA